MNRLIAAWGIVLMCAAATTTPEPIVKPNVPDGICQWCWWCAECWFLPVMPQPLAPPKPEPWMWTVGQ